MLVASARPARPYESTATKRAAPSPAVRPSITISSCGGSGRGAVHQLLVWQFAMLVTLSGGCVDKPPTWAASRRIGDRCVTRSADRRRHSPMPGKAVYDLPPRRPRLTGRAEFPESYPATNVAPPGLTLVNDGKYVDHTARRTAYASIGTDCLRTTRHSDGATVSSDQPTQGGSQHHCFEPIRSG
jgi:hypothetical protein